MSKVMTVPLRIVTPSWPALLSMPIWEEWLTTVRTVWPFRSIVIPLSPMTSPGELSSWQTTSAASLTLCVTTSPHWSVTGAAEAPAALSASAAAAMHPEERKANFLGMDGTLSYDAESLIRVAQGCPEVNPLADRGPT